MTMRFKHAYILSTCLLAFQISFSANLFSSDSIRKYGDLTDDYIRLIRNPDYTATSNVGGTVRPSSIWTRAVFYEGHMAWYAVRPDTAHYNYAYNWAVFHNWEMSKKLNTGTNADFQCIGQIYIELYKLAPDPNKIKVTKSCMDYNIGTGKSTYWTWIDAIQMAMPIFAGLGKITGDTTYYHYMWDSYMYTRNTLGVVGTYNPKDSLWWRDANFNRTVVDTYGKPIYWSRGNGWVYTALVRVLNTIPKTEAHYQQYLNDYLAMSQALLKWQREDGFWNPSLASPNYYGGKETSGTGLFVYGMAWGINQGLLPRDKYLTAVQKGWIGLSRDAIHPDNGFLGWAQGTGDDPSDGQPLSYTLVPNFEDYGAGCVLLAAAESWKLSRTLEREDSLANNLDKTLVKPIHIDYQQQVLRLQTTEPSKLSIFGINGTIMLENKFVSETVVDLNSWPKGIYIVRILSSKGCQTLKIKR
jgi:unsaturated rhamnogalacturonyl hydrolase